MLDIAIAVFTALLTLATAYLGVHVTLHPAEDDSKKSRYKSSFIACGLSAAALIGVQTYRNSVAQEKLSAELSRIETQYRNAADG
jgi:hypothetical protein